VPGSVHVSPIVSYKKKMFQLPSNFFFLSSPKEMCRTIRKRNSTKAGFSTGRERDYFDIAIISNIISEYNNCNMHFNNIIMLIKLLIISFFIQMESDLVLKVLITVLISLMYIIKLHI